MYGKPVLAQSLLNTYLESRGDRLELGRAPRNRLFDGKLDLLVKAGEVEDCVDNPRAAGGGMRHVWVFFPEEGCSGARIWRGRAGIGPKKQHAE